jgi:hypothetical protein
VDRHSRLAVPDAVELERHPGCACGLDAVRLGLGRAVLGFDGDLFTIRFDGGDVAVPARGEWSGDAVVSASAVRVWTDDLPAGDPVSFRVRDGKLLVGSLLLPCEWLAEGAVETDLALNADIVALLRAGERLDDSQLKAMGLLSKVRAAKRERTKRISRAAANLRELGVKRADIVALVDSAVGDRPSRTQT